MKIAVLMGSTSPERGISLLTGRSVEKALFDLSYDVECVDFTDDLNSTIPILSNCDLVFNALHGGIGEDGTIQGFLDCLKIPYTGSGVTASSICMDKNLCKSIISQFGYKTPDWKLVNKKTGNPSFDTFPVIVKPNSLGSTVGLTLVENQSIINNAIETAFEYDELILIESYISGRELTVSIVGETILPIVEIIPSKKLYDYECKYTQGMSSYICSPELPNNLSEEICQIGKHVYDRLGCSNYGRIDFLLDEENIPWILEVNTLPGMTDTSLVPMAANEIGWSFSHLIERIIKGVGF